MVKWGTRIDEQFERREVDEGRKVVGAAQRGAGRDGGERVGGHAESRKCRMR